MIPFRKRTRTKDHHGAERDGRALKSLGAVSVLRQCPKFNATGGTPATCAKYAPGASADGTVAGSPSTAHSRTASLMEDSVARVSANGSPCARPPFADTLMVPVKNPSRTRPLDIKKAKKLQKAACGGEGLSEIAAALKERALKRCCSRKLSCAFTASSAAERSFLWTF